MLEQGFTIGYPWATGVAVDGLLDARPGALVPLVGIWLAHTVVGLVRQAYDTRLFTRVYAETVTEMLIAQDKATGGRRGLAQLAGRAGLARELVDFLEDDVPAALTAVLGCFGALALLIVYEPRAGGLAAALLVPVAWLNWRYARRAAELNADLNDAAEREVDVVAARDRSRAEAHFSAVARLRVRLSDAEAHTWGSPSCSSSGSPLACSSCSPTRHRPPRERSTPPWPTSSGSSKASTSLPMPSSGPCRPATSAAGWATRRLRGPIDRHLDLVQCAAVDRVLGTGDLRAGRGEQEHDHSCDVFRCSEPSER